MFPLEKTQKVNNVWLLPIQMETASEFLIPKDKHITAHDGQVVTKGEVIVDGPADPADILRITRKRGSCKIYY